MPVKAQAEKKGLDVIFKEAGFDWREAGLLDARDELRTSCRLSAAPQRRTATLRAARQGRPHAPFVSLQMAAGCSHRWPPLVDIRDWL